MFNGNDGKPTDGTAAVANKTVRKKLGFRSASMFELMSIKVVESDK